MALELSFEIISRRIEEEVIVIDDDDDDDDDDDADSFFPVSPIRPAFIEELSESEEEEDSAIERSRPPSVIDLTIMEDDDEVEPATEPAEGEVPVEVSTVFVRSFIIL